MTAVSPTAVAESGEAAATAESFVAARLAARATPGYPGRIPRSLNEAYAIQECAIGLFPDRIIGWKVGGVPPAQQAVLGAGRIAGPIFAGNLWTDAGSSNALPAIEGGFAAVEAEFVMRIGHGVDPGQMDWSLAQAFEAVDAVFIGVELAGSSLSTINDMGSAVVVSDFGNNGGLLIGAELPDWRARLDAITVETTLAGAVVGAGGSSSLGGGAIESVRFLLGHCAARGRPLTAGSLVSTGAVTGVHRARIGEAFTCAFDGVGVIRGTVVRAEG